MSFTNAGNEHSYLKNISIMNINKVQQLTKQNYSAILAESRATLELFRKRAIVNVTEFIQEKQAQAIENGLFELTLPFTYIIETHFSGSYKDYVSEIKYIYNLHDPINYPSDKIDNICKIKFAEYICSPLFTLYKEHGYIINFRVPLDTCSDIFQWFTITWAKNMNT